MRKVYFTILGFQKSIDANTDYQLLDKQEGTNTADAGAEPSAATNYLSYYLAYNHNTCRIEYFMINYGYPRALKLSDFPLEARAILDNKATNEDFSANRNKIDFDKLHEDHALSGGTNNPLYAKHFSDLNVNGGKLTQRTFHIFLTNVLLHHKKGYTLHNMYDIRLISALMYLKQIKNYIISPGMLPSLFKRCDDLRIVSSIDPFSIHTQERFIKEHFVYDLNNLFGTTYIPMSIPKAEEATCIKDIRAEFKVKSFRNGHELTQKINLFNAKLTHKFDKLRNILEILEITSAAKRYVNVTIEIIRKVNK